MLEGMQREKEEEARKALGPTPDEIARRRWRMLRRVVMPAMRWKLTQRKKYEALQQQLFKDAISRGIKFNATGSTHDLTMQGDEEMYTIESLIERAVLQKNKEIRAAITQMWDLPGMSKEGGELLKESYIEFITALHKALVPDIAREEATDAASHDWDSDSGGRKHTMTHAQFDLAVFELADLWCHSIEAEEYVGFLDQLLRTITYYQPEEGAGEHEFEVSEDYQLAAQFGATSGLFRDFDEIECILFEGMEEEEVQEVMDGLIEDHLQLDDAEPVHDGSRSSPTRTRSLSIPNQRKRANSNAGLQRQASVKGASLLQKMSNSFRFERGWRKRGEGPGEDSIESSMSSVASGSRLNPHALSTNSRKRSGTMASIGSFRSFRAMTHDSDEEYDSDDSDESSDESGDEHADAKYSSHPDARVVRKMTRAAMKRAIRRVRHASTQGVLSLEVSFDSEDVAKVLVPSPIRRRPSRTTGGGSRPLARVNSRARAGSTDLGLWHGLLQKQVSQRGDAMKAKMAASKAKQAREKVQMREHAKLEKEQQKDRLNAAKRAERLETDGAAVMVMQAAARGHLVRVEMKANERRRRLKQQRTQKQIKHTQQRQLMQEGGVCERRKSLLMAANLRHTEQQARQEEAKSAEKLVVHSEAATMMQASARGHLARRSTAKPVPTTVLLPGGALADVPVTLHKLARAKERVRQRREERAASSEAGGDTSLYKQVHEETEMEAATAAVTAATATSGVVSAAVTVQTGGAGGTGIAASESGGGGSLELVLRSSCDPIDPTKAGPTAGQVEPAITRQGGVPGLSSARYALAVQGMGALEQGLSCSSGDGVVDPVTRQLLELVNGCWRQRVASDETPATTKFVHNESTLSDQDIQRGAEGEQWPLPPVQRAAEGGQYPSPPTSARRRRPPGSRNARQYRRHDEWQSKNGRKHDTRQEGTAGRLQPLQAPQAPHSQDHPLLQQAQQRAQQQAQQHRQHRHHYQHRQYRQQRGFGTSTGDRGKFKLASPARLGGQSSKHTCMSLLDVRAVKHISPMVRGVPLVSALQEWRPQEQEDDLEQEEWQDKHGQLYRSILNFKQLEPRRPKRAVATEYMRSMKRLSPTALSATTPLPLPVLSRLSATPPLPAVLLGVAREAGEVEAEIDSYLNSFT
jgi:hypothetical protein